MVFRTDHESAGVPTPDGPAGQQPGPDEGSRISLARRRFNAALAPTDPYLPPIVGLLVGLSLLMVDLGSAEASSFLRVSALFGSILLITDSATGLIQAFGRSEPEPEPFPPAMGEQEAPAPAGPPQAEREHPGRAYIPPPPPVEEERTTEEAKRRSGSQGALPTITLIVAIALALASLGTATTSMRLLSIATAILIFIRLYLLFGPRRT